MKKTVLLFILLNITIIQLGYSQVGIGTNTPSAKSILDLTASDKGFLLPRMNSTQRVAIAPTATDIGMQVFDTTTNSIWYWDGTIWLENKVVANNGVTKTANTIELGGALTKPTTVSALTNINKMSFTGTGIDAFNVDGTTFSVDATNNTIGIGTATPNASAALDITATNKGFLPPRVSLTSNTLDLDGVPGQTDGLIVYNTNTSLASGKGLHEWRDAKWRKVGEAEGITLTTSGTGIYVNGDLKIAQEINLLMTADFTVLASGPSVVDIGNLNNEIIDNMNTYTGTGTSNLFQVTESGIYCVTMNIQLVGTAGNQPVIGIWDSNAGEWIARTNDTLPVTGSYTYTLITYVQLNAGGNYRFSAGKATNNLTIKAFSTGTTGSGPVSAVSVKRVK